MTPIGFHRDLISTLAARHRLPAIYSYRYFVTWPGGLISYGRTRPTFTAARLLTSIAFLRARSLPICRVDRIILKGQRPEDLAVQCVKEC